VIFPNSFSRIVSYSLFGIIILNLSVLTLWADFEHREWPFHKNIELPSSFDGTSYIKVSLDENVFERSLPDFSDIRIVDMTNRKELPYKLQIEQGERVKKSYEVTRQDYQEILGQYTEFVADLGKDGILHNELEIQTYSTNFQYDVLTEASNDKKEWMVLSQDSIFDLTIVDKKFKAQNTTVKFPANTYRYIKAKVITGDAPLFKVTGLQSHYFQESLPRKRPLMPLVDRRIEDKENKTSELVLDLGFSGFPVNEIIFRIQEDNFYRKVKIESSDDKNNWIIVNDSGSIYSYRNGELRRKTLSILFPEIKSRYLRITIFNEDDSPLSYSEITLLAFEHQVIFEANSKSDYSIYYGNKVARKPIYDLERTFEFMNEEDIPEANLGEEMGNIDYAPTIPVTERFPWLLPVSVGISALLIALLVVKTYRKVNKSLGPRE